MRRHLDRRALAWIASGLGSLLALALAATSCLGSSAPGVDDCSNLREIHATADVSGEFGTLSDFTFSGEGSGTYDVIPPDASPCANDIAAKLEAACRICDKDEDSCQATVQSVLDTPTDNCAACGDDVCSPSENPSNCPQDCSDACGNGTCEGTEDFQNCPADCGVPCGNGECEAGENPVNCPEDCATPCGNGTCDGDESRASCPEDCTEPCGDGFCRQGETPENCPTDCAQTACGNDDCEDGESQVLCPADCGGCVPNTWQCMGNVLVVCNVDGMSSTHRQCGADMVCADGSCRAENPVEGQTDVEDQMLGAWRVTVKLNALDAVDRTVDIGNAVYELEVFEVNEPVGQFGVWGWKGALKANSFCFLDQPGFDAGGGTCTPFTNTRLGTCDAVSCDEVTEVPASGTFNTVSQEFIMTSDRDTEGDMYHLDGLGYLNINLDIAGTGTIVNDQVADVPCESWCSFIVNRGGTYESTYPRYESSDWTVGFIKTN